MNREATQPQWKRWFCLGACWLLGGLFIYAGGLKASDPQSFADAIAAFQLLPAALINSVALSLPILEILSGFLLITGWQRRVGIQSVLALTVLFAVVILTAIARGLQIDCGCFGSSSSISAHLQLWFALARDAVLFSLAMALYRHKPASVTLSTCSQERS